MIGELEENLKRLSADPMDLFHVHVRARIGKKATDHYEKKLKDFILHMPSLVARIDNILMKEKKGSPASRLGEYLLIYLYDPMDFLPEQDNGLFGYLDDAYFVAMAYLMIIEKMDSSRQLSQDKKTKDWIFEHLECVKYLIPDESRKIDRLLSDIVTHQILCYPVNV